MSCNNGNIEDSTQEQNVEKTSLEDESILNTVFSTCDIEKNGLVLVSHLIEFISPYLQFNRTHLEELKKILDPNNCNHAVDSITFSNAIKEWSGLQSQCTLTDQAEETKENESRHVRQSTPSRQSIGRAIVTDYETGLLNLSNISSYSEIGGNTTVGVDAALLQEHINELEFQNRKLHDLVADIRTQLITSEEQNNVLQNDVEQIAKKLQNEQKLSEQLQKQRNEYEEQRENINNVLKKNGDLNQQLTLFKKEVNQLKSVIIDFEAESQKYHENITELTKKEETTRQYFEKLQIELEAKDTEILTLKEKTNELSEVCKEKHNIIKQLYDDVENFEDWKRGNEKRLKDLSDQNIALSQHLKECSRIDNQVERGKNAQSSQSKSSTKNGQPSKCSTPLQMLRSRLKFCNSESPIPKFSNKDQSFNSPGFLKMINNPVSPLRVDTPRSINSKEFTDHRSSSGEHLQTSVIDYSTCKQTKNVSSKKIIQESEDAVQVLTKEKLDISVNLDSDRNIICSIQAQPNFEKQPDKNKISPSKQEQGTQTIARNSLISKPVFCVKVDDTLSEYSTPPENINTESNNNSINVCEAKACSPELNDSVFYSLLESKQHPDKLSPKSCSPVTSDEENCWVHMSNTQADNCQVSLHTELMHKTTIDLDDKFENISKEDLQLQYQDRIQTLTRQLAEHTNCQETIKKYQEKQTNLELLLQDLNTEFQKIETDLRNANIDIQRQNIILEETQLQNKHVKTALDEATKEIAAFQTKKQKDDDGRENYVTQIQELRISEKKIKAEFENKVRENLSLIKELDLYKIKNKEHEIQQKIFDIEICKVKQDCSEFNEQCGMLTNDVQLLRKDIDEKEKENQQAVSENKELLKKIRTKIEENTKLENMIQNQNNKLTNLRTEFQILKNKAEDYAKLTEIHETLKNELHDFHTNYESIQKELQKLEQENDTLKTDLKTKQKQIGELQSKCVTMKKLEADKVELAEKYNSLLITKSKLENNVEALKAKQEKSFSQASQLKLNCGIVETKLRQKESETQKVKEDLTKIYTWLEKSKSEHEQQKLQWTNTEKELREKINTLSQKNEETPNESPNFTCPNCEKTQCELLDLKLVHDNLKAKFKDLENEARPSTKPAIKKGTRVEILHHKIEKLEEKLCEEQTKTRSLSVSLKKTTTENMELQTKFEISEKERHDILLQRDHSQARQKKLAHNIEALELKMQTYRQTICELNEEVISRSKDMVTINNNSIEFEDKFTTTKIKYEDLVKYLHSVLNIMKVEREALGSQTLCTVRQWKSILEKVTPDSPILNLTKNKMSLIIPSNSEYETLDEELYLLKNQVCLTNILLKTLAKVKEDILDMSHQPTSSLSDRGISGSSSVEVNNKSLLETVVNNKFELKGTKILLHRASMSPDSPAAEMADVSSHFSTMKILSPPGIELNNNKSARGLGLVETTQVRDIDSNMTQQHAEDAADVKVFVPTRSESGSSSDTGSTESLGIEIVARHSAEIPTLTAGLHKVDSQQSVQEGLARQFRSLSEGAVVTHQLTPTGDVTVFPNLRDNILEAMGLHAESDRRERLTEEEVEAKFQTLTLAFAIDAVTLADRRERQRRQRDQAEDNLATEVARLVQCVHRLNPLCVDVETTELVTGLLNQLDVIVQASSRISTSAEVFGSVQQEWRLAESVNLMLNHLRNLRQQRDMARRHLQCTKRMLQESTSTAEAVGQVIRQRPILTNGRFLIRRRASIATIPRPPDSPRPNGSPTMVTALVDGVTRRGTTRRTSPSACSEYSARSWDSKTRHEWSPVERPPSLGRPVRPSRLDLGRDLTKISEGTCESAINNNCEVDDTDLENCDFETPTGFSYIEDEINEQEAYIEEPMTIRERVTHSFHIFGEIIEEWWNQLVATGTFHEFCCLGAIICFALCTIILGNLMLEMEYARRGIRMQRIPWFWMTWEELVDLFVSVQRDNRPFI